MQINLLMNFISLNFDKFGLLKIDSKFIAVAVNGEFISKKDYSKIFLHDGDVVEVVSPHPGG